MAFCGYWFEDDPRKGYDKHREAEGALGKRKREEKKPPQEARSAKGYDKERGRPSTPRRRALPEDARGKGVRHELRSVAVLEF